MAGDQIFISTIFIAGIFSFFSPCLIPVLPVYISMFSGGVNNKEKFKYDVKLGILNINLLVIAKTLVFVIGISTSFVLLGFGAGFLGAFLNSKVFITLCGLIVVILGIHQTDIV